MKLIKRDRLVNALLLTGQPAHTFLASTIQPSRFLAKTLLTTSVILAASSVSAAPFSGTNDGTFTINQGGLTEIGVLTNNGQLTVASDIRIIKNIDIGGGNTFPAQLINNGSLGISVGRPSEFGAHYSMQTVASS